MKGVLGVAATAAVAKVCSDQFNGKPSFSCRMLGPSASRGHKIRDGEVTDNKPAAVPAKARVVIVGGGIAGLSAAWWMRKQGFTDFILLELEKEVGGNSASGKNSVSPYPWGAHYIPLANKESQYVRMLFEETGVIEGYDGQGEPIYNELYLCHEPQERLFKDGVFSDGLVPKRGLQAEEHTQIERFFHQISQMRAATGSDGKPAFAIPVDYSSSDNRWRALDKISMKEWLHTHHFDAAPLLWYIDYCCRDDYGSTAEHVSAWAGIHYFAGRKGTASNAEMNWVVTWPQGNGFIVDSLRKSAAEQVKAGQAVVSIKQTDRKTLLTNCMAATGELCVYESDYVIFSAPRFIAPYIIEGYNHSLVDKKMLVYAPWLVANITLTGIPDARGADLSWDNVSYRSPSLGYVVATHQNVTTRQGPLVITYYLPLSAYEPSAARQMLLSLSASRWSEEITKDLESMHPGIGQKITSMDIWPWGHGMIRPTPGYIWGDLRHRLMQNQGNVFFAHSDMSGISNFEEAQYRGAEAARQVLSKMGETS